MGERAAANPPRDALRGVRVALLESRRSGEMAELVRRHGGVPVSVPSMREAPTDAAADVAAFLDRIETPGRHLVVLLTGVGAGALFREAARQGRLASLRRGLSGAALVCRGPKPTAAIRNEGLKPAVQVAEPYTTSEILEAMASIDVANADVTLVHYGERNALLAAALRARGAAVGELCLYEWRLPLDIEPLRGVVRELIDGGIEAVVFTSQVQGRHLLWVARDMGVEPQLVRAMNANTVVAAIGPVCRAALLESGIVPHVVPEHPKMGQLIAALAEHFAQRGDAGGSTPE